MAELSVRRQPRELADEEMNTAARRMSGGSFSSGITLPRFLTAVQMQFELCGRQMRMLGALRKFIGEDCWSNH
jgi:hypothetical protein